MLTVDENVGHGALARDRCKHSLPLAAIAHLVKLVDVGGGIRLQNFENLFRLDAERASALRVDDDRTGLDLCLQFPPQ